MMPSLRGHALLDAHDAVFLCQGCSFQQTSLRQHSLSHCGSPKSTRSLREPVQCGRAGTLGAPGGLFLAYGALASWPLCP